MWGALPPFRPFIRCHSARTASSRYTDQIDRYYIDAYEREDHEIIPVGDNFETPSFKITALGLATPCATMW